MKERFKVIPAVYLILRRDDEVLLLRRANTGYLNGWYSVPAGHHEVDESLTESMAREAKEEIGITIDPKDLRFLHVQHRQKCNDGERIDFYFTTDNFAGEITNAEPDKCDELRWVSIDVLPQNVVPSVRTALEAILSGQLLGEVIEPAAASASAT